MCSTFSRKPAQQTAGGATLTGGAAHPLAIARIRSGSGDIKAPSRELSLSRSQRLHADALVDQSDPAGGREHSWLALGGGGMMGRVWASAVDAIRHNSRPGSRRPAICSSSSLEDEFPGDCEEGRGGKPVEATVQQQREQQPCVVVVDAATPPHE